MGSYYFSFITFTQTIGAFDIFAHVKVKMKMVDYSVHQKLITLLLSVITGCQYTSDINDKLVPDKVATQMLDMEKFPVQSQINELIRRIDQAGVGQLKAVHHQLFVEN